MEAENGKKVEGRSRRCGETRKGKKLRETREKQGKKEEGNKKRRGEEDGDHTSSPGRHSQREAESL